MKILIINEFVQLGGAEQIVKNQREIFISQGHEVKCLCFNYGKARKDELQGYDVIHSSFPLNKLIFNPLYYRKIRKYIKTVNPDKIIIHSMFSSSITQYFAIRGFDSYQIIHDYYAICPNYLCVRLTSDQLVCEGYKCGKCIKECYHHNSKISLLLKLYITKINELLRKKYIKKLISPSEKLNSYLKEYGYDSVCINNPLKNMGEIEEKVCKNEKVNYIYAGGINDHKGIVDFLETFIKFAMNHNVILDIYGEINDNNIRDRFNYLINSCDAINYHGVVLNDVLVNNLHKAKYMIMPSKWMENYPTSVLEAMATGVVVIGSDRGGIPEILSDNRGLVYKFGDDNKLMKTLENSYYIDNIVYENIRKNAYDYVITNNDFNVYYKKLSNIIGIKELR